MSALKEIRKNIYINKIVRTILRRSYKELSQSLDAFMQRWTTSGVVDCSFKSIPFKMFNKCDDGLVSHFYYGLKYKEETDLSLFIQLAKGSSCILDIGANTGIYSILSAKANPDAQLFAFEPYPVNAARFNLNMELNGLKNVTLVQEAMGEACGAIEITVPKNETITDVASMNKSFSEKMYPELQWEQISVPLNTIDHFAKTIALPVDLIKCDVELFEMSVFKGGLDILQKDRPTIIFECFLDAERISFFNNILKSYQYYLYLILEDGLVYSQEGIENAQNGLNYLITPVKPNRTFLKYTDEATLRKELLFRPGV